MRMLTLDESQIISGGAQPAAVAAVSAAFIAGSWVAGNFASVLAPVSTFITTSAGVVGCGIAGTMVMPVVGTVAGAGACGIAGYYLGSTFVTAGAYIGGGAAGAAGALLALGGL